MRQRATPFPLWAEMIHQNKAAFTIRFRRTGGRGTSFHNDLLQAKRLVIKPTIAGTSLVVAFAAFSLLGAVPKAHGRDSTDRGYQNGSRGWRRGFGTGPRRKCGGGAPGQG